MKIISFAWTTPAILARQKTVTRRAWNPDYARTFRKHELVAAYNQSPRVGGKRIGLLRLTEQPYFESESKMPDSDWEAEGFAYLESIGAHVHGRTPRQLWEQARAHPEHMWVIRFEIIEVAGERARVLAQAVKA